MNKSVKVFATSFVLLVSACSNANVATNDATMTSNQSYIAARNNFKTQLTTLAKAPQDYLPMTATDKIDIVTYPSGNLSLKGYLEKSNIQAGKKSPVLVYLHGGFALDHFDIEVTKPFLDKGFVVFAPSYRAENGNDGNFELFMGEVDDAKAAVEWIAKQPFTDPEHIYVFGHSIGGGLALQLAFFPNLPIKQSGSSAGLYSVENIKDWGFTFDTSEQNELQFRVPLLNLDKLAHQHALYVGKNDTFQNTVIASNSKFIKNQTNLLIENINGDHGSSLEGAMNQFIKTYYKP